MPAGALIVYLVDDDPAVRDSLGLMLGLAGYSTASFADAESFVTGWREDWRGCVVTDLRLPGMSGLELQRELRRRGSRLPVIVVTGHGDVPSARVAFRAAAVDFLEKPFDDMQLRAAIDTAFALEEDRLRSDEQREEQARRLERLTPREREVLELAARGLHAKEIGASLGISSRTVEVHKARVMEKLGVRNIGELVRFAVAGKAG